MWWASHQGAGMVQLGKAQPRSRAVMALRMWGGKTREARPMSRIRPSPPSTTGMMSASQAILRTVEAVTGPVNSSVPVPCRVPVAGGRVRVGAVAECPEPVEQVTVVNGDHDLRAQPSRGGQVSGGEGDFAATDEAVEEPLRPGALVQGGSAARCSAVAGVSRAGPAAARTASGPACAVWPCGAFPVRGRCGGWWRCS